MPHIDVCIAAQAEQEKAALAEDDDCLVLSTIHSAWDLEWDAVYVIHAADGSIPSNKLFGIAPDGMDAILTGADVARAPKYPSAATPTF